ncbi:hypothetical protein, conserved [Leishmania donovani]|uniref:CUE domain-containing protein n=1 Tax=Leishmania donovani TaxID=5661 RepID=E9BUV2_LEIDO|nr:hypothetical protein, conserved [Leishmania donovani]CBZ39031.1 hypothetical protein, conserved [Leishmania donovani]
MSSSLQDAFPDGGGAVCSTFFSSVDLSEKLWAGIERLAEADDLTFWIVVANHDRLPVVLVNVITAVDHAHSSHSRAQRKAVPPNGEQRVIEILIRLATSTDLCLRRHVDPASLATRLSVLLPWKVLFPVSLLLLRHSGAAASVTVTSLILLNPGYLCTLNTFMPTWWDGVNRFSVRCARELQRGRFQRQPGDILSSFEQVYRITKQLWAAVQCAPFLSDYMSLPRTLRALRVIVDVLSPVLQHFIMVCDELTPRRPILSRANSVIVNAAINTSSALLLYHTYAVQGPHRRQDADGFCVPQLINRTYSHLREYLRQHGRGFVEETLQAYGNGSLLGLIHYLYPPARFADDAGEKALGQVMLTLTKDISDSNDFAEAVHGSRQRFFELLLLEVVRQGVHIDDLLARHLVTTEEASKLGASEGTLTNALAGLPASNAVAEAALADPSPAPTSPSPAPAATDIVDDPLVAMVMEVFPQFSAAGVRTALNFYSNDVEQFIMDASVENLPPHLVGPLTASAQSDAELAAALAAQEAGVEDAAAPATSIHAAESPATRADASAHLALYDFDDNFDPDALYRLMGRDLYEMLADSDGDAGYADGGANDDEVEDETAYKITMNDPQSYMSDAFDIDEEMKMKIRVLNEIMYEDELDDGQQDVHLAGGDIIDDASDSDGDDNGGGGRRGRERRRGGGGVDGYAPGYLDTETWAAVEGQERAAASAASPPQQRAPRDEYHDKRYHEKRSKDRLARTKQIQSERNERVPAYANKKKTSKAKAGGSKGSLQRAVRRGKFTADA